MVTSVQRFGGAVNVHLHFHTLVLDGLCGYPHSPSYADIRTMRSNRFAAAAAVRGKPAYSA